MLLSVEFFTFLCRSVVHSNVRLSSLNGALGDQRGIPFTSGIHQASGWRSFDFDAFADLAQGGVSMISSDDVHLEFYWAAVVFILTMVPKH